MGKLFSSDSSDSSEDEGAYSRKQPLSSTPCISRSKRTSGNEHLYPSTKKRVLSAASFLQLTSTTSQPYKSPRSMYQQEIAPFKPVSADSISDSSANISSASTEDAFECTSIERERMRLKKTEASLRTKTLQQTTSDARVSLDDRGKEGDKESSEVKDRSMKACERPKTLDELRATPRSAPKTKPNVVNYVSPFGKGTWRKVKAEQLKEMKRTRDNELLVGSVSNENQSTPLETTPVHMIEPNSDVLDWLWEGDAIDEVAHTKKKPRKKQSDGNPKDKGTDNQPAQQTKEVEASFINSVYESSGEGDEIWPKKGEPRVKTSNEPLVLAEATTTHPRIQVNKRLSRYLYEYQRKGIEWMFQGCYKECRGLILGDDMGLGKTIQVIGLLSALLHKTGTSRDRKRWKELRKLREHQLRHAPKQRRYTQYDADHYNTGPILIVVPATILENWRTELSDWICCEVLVLLGKPKDRQDKLDRVDSLNEENDVHGVDTMTSSDITIAFYPPRQQLSIEHWDTLHEIELQQPRIGEYEIVICSYDMLKIHNDELAQIPFYLVIFDEMHCMKNSKAQVTMAARKLPCKRKIGLTGTLMQNNHKELFCLLDTISPGSLGEYENFKNEIAKVITYGRKKSASHDEIELSKTQERELQGMLKPYYLRRLKNINPYFDTIHKHDTVVFCELTRYQIAAYRRVLASPDFQMILRGGLCRCPYKRNTGCTIECYIKDPSAHEKLIIWDRLHPTKTKCCKKCPSCVMLVCIAQLLKLSSHMDLLKVDPAHSEEIQKSTKEFAELAFGPDVDAIGGIYKAHRYDDLQRTETCGKMVVLDKLLGQWTRTRKKTLIYSRSTRMLDILQTYLIGKGYAYCRLDGTTPTEERQKTVDTFNHNRSIPVFLISTKAGSVGLNITSASNVVLFDPSWNPAHDQQAQDRAYRIGQKQDVHVYRLLTLGTIEELIYVRQIYKQQLEKSTIAKGRKVPRTFEGVQGDKYQQGKIFGIANLLTFKESGILNEILHGNQEVKTSNEDGIIMRQNELALARPSPIVATRRRKNHLRDVDIDADEVAGEILGLLDDEECDEGEDAMRVAVADPISRSEGLRVHDEADDRNGMIEDEVSVIANTTSHELLLGDLSQSQSPDSPVLTPEANAVVSQARIQGLRPTRLRFNRS